ncbi:uncharacterized protein LOC141720904 [Apium graveolens]|uniref:uncharacterized protein LOC141720904 n=1 Tax=Apium graveolens TaxID=4045 RepID=UPI003D7A4FC7
MGSICIEDIEKNSTEDDAKNHLPKETAPGDVIWVKLGESSWWPAQVSDEDSISGSCNPIKKADGEVLVRLYGSYKYLYVDPVTSHSEFVRILQQSNGKYDDIMMKTLKKDLARIKSGISKRQRAEPKASKTPTKGKKGMVQTDEDGSRKRKQGMQKSREPNGMISEPTSAANSEKQRSARRMKIMRRLGLIAPPGSPFRPKNMNVE